MRTVRRAASIAVSCLMLAGCAHTNHASAPAGSPVSQPPRVRTQAAPSAAPGRSTLPSSSRAVPSTSGAGEPRPVTACLAAGFAASPGSEDGGASCAERAAEILDVAVSQTTVQPGDRVHGRVVTTSNVGKRRSADRRLRHDLGEDGRRAIRADVHGRSAPMVRSRKLYDAGDRAKHARRCRDTRDTADRALVY